jgi:hypothetical protein
MVTIVGGQYLADGDPLPVDVEINALGRDYEQVVGIRITSSDCARC